MVVLLTLNRLNNVKLPEEIAELLAKQDEQSQTLPKTKSPLQCPSGMRYSEDIATMLRQQDKPTQTYLYG